MKTMKQIAKEVIKDGFLKGRVEMSVIERTLNMKHFKKSLHHELLELEKEMVNVWKEVIKLKR